MSWAISKLNNFGLDDKEDNSNKGGACYISTMCVLECIFVSLFI